MTTFSQCFVITAATESTRIYLWSKKLGSWKIYNPEALRRALSSLWRHSPESTGYKLCKIPVLCQVQVLCRTWPNLVGIEGLCITLFKLEVSGSEGELSMTA